jgi:hypothetical protein
MKFKLPSWLRRDDIKLPPWAKKVDGSPKAGITIEVDTKAAYTDWLHTLGVVQADQYWLEVAYQCTKLDLQAALVGTEYDPRTSGKNAHFIFKRAEGLEMSRFPKGRGAEMASQGKEARGHYTRVRGSLPF